MRKTQLLLAIGLSGALLLAGCSTPTVDPTAGMTTKQVYANAQSYLNNGNWDKAISFFDKLEIKAAGTMLAQQAQIDKAYAHYKNGDTALALTTLNRFTRLHPTSPAIPYALYLKGLTTFHDNTGFLSNFTRQNLAERDQQSLEDSFASFNELVTRFPNSTYSADARQRMVFIKNTLALSDVFVARYYLKRDAYVAAINRAQLSLTQYNNTPASPEALYILYQSYNKLGLNSLRDDVKKIFTLNYPALNINTEPMIPAPKPWWQVW